MLLINSARFEEYLKTPKNPTKRKPRFPNFGYGRRPVPGDQHPLPPMGDEADQDQDLGRKVGKVRKEVQTLPPYSPVGMPLIMILSQAYGDRQRA